MKDRTCSRRFLRAGFPARSRHFPLARGVRRNVGYRILLHMRSHRQQVSPDAVGIRPLRREAKGVLTITGRFRVLVVVIGFSIVADQ